MDGWSSNRDLLSHFFLSRRSCLQIGQAKTGLCHHLRFERNSACQKSLQGFGRGQISNASRRLSFLHSCFGCHPKGTYYLDSWSEFYFGEAPKCFEFSTGCFTLKLGKAHTSMPPQFIPPYI